MNLGLAGKTAIVTGASRGIGAATARALAQEGVNLSLVARDESALLSLARELSAEHGVQAIAVRADLTGAEAVSVAISSSIKQLGRADILVNNAGASPFGSFDLITDEQWHAAFDLKILGYTRCIRAVLPHMRERGSGRIINVIGMAGRYATPTYVLGCLNAALLHITKSLADLVAPDGVIVIAINPGTTATDRMLLAMESGAADAGTDAQSFAKRYLDDVPLRRFARPEEIGRIIAVLSSEISDLATGSAYQADAGAPKGAF